MPSGSDPDYAAVVLDLDGVVTATRRLHIGAWKRTFDEYLAALPGGFNRPFDPERDYEDYVDGKPREDGIRSFLDSRGIRASDEQRRALGDRKNSCYRALLEREGPHVFPDAIEALRRWKERGIPLAVVSSSRNCALVLKTARIDAFFRARVDGEVGHELGLRGKPEPDYFLEASRRLGVPPSRSVMVEDAIAGVAAGRRGGFGLVVGMDRSGKHARALKAAGAGRIVSSLMELI